MINYGRQFIDRFDKKAVDTILKSKWLTQGPTIELFENSLKKKFGANHCCVVANGTAALHLTGLALGWKKEDIILCSPISFLSASNAAIYSGAKPDFVDIDKETYNIDLYKLEKKIKFYLSKRKKVKAIISTDFAGNPCDWKVLRKIGKKYNIKIINDNCHAIGATYNKDRSYAVKFADVVTHSYHPVKNITTGEGGAVLSNNKKICDRIRILRTHGIEKGNKKNGPWFYEMRSLGFNYRITDIQCALGISQLRKINIFLKKRNLIAQIYNESFKNNELFKIPKVKKNCMHAYHFYPLQINFEKIKISKRVLFKKLEKRNIKLQVHYIPVHLHPYYKKKFGFRKGNFPVAEKFYEKEISLPVYFSLKRKEIYKVIKSIKTFCVKK